MAAAVATTVQDVFERLASDCTHDASDLKRLWGAMRTDAQVASANLGRCLLVHIQAPQKHKGDKEIPTCFQNWVRAMPRDPQSKDWAETLVVKLLWQLAELIPHGAKQSRQRVLTLFVAMLRGLPQDTELDADFLKFAEEQLRSHLRDKDDGVRELVMVALCKLVAVEEGCSSVRGTPAFEEVIHSLHTDLSQDVRAAVVQRLPLDDSCLEDVLRHRRDRAAKVGAAVYQRAAQDVGLARPPREGAMVASPAQRLALMRDGLTEGRPEVLKAAQGLLGRWYAEDAGSDVVRLLEVFGPQENPDVCHLVLEHLATLKLWNPLTWLQAASANRRSPRALAALAQAAIASPAGNGSTGPAPAAWLADVTPQLAFVCVYACVLLDRLSTAQGSAAATRVAAAVAQAEASEGAQAEEVLETFLAAPHDMAQLCCLAARAGPPHRDVTAHLMALASLPHLNWTDAFARQAAEVALASLITQDARPDEPHASTTGRGYRPPAGAGGDGSWEGAVLNFAAAVYGGGTRLVAGVLPLVLQMAAELGVDSKRLEQGSEGPLVQVLAYLHLLMVAAGPGVPPSASATLRQPGADEQAGADAGADAEWPFGPGPRSVTLVQAVDEFAWTSAGHPSPAVRAAAVRCRVILCMRDGGSSQLPRTVTMLAPLLPTQQHIATAAASGRRRGGGRAGSGGSAAAAQQQQQLLQEQLPRWAALQGLIDLSLMWGEPMLTAELGAAEAAAVRNRRLDAVATQLAALGMNADGEGPQGEGAAVGAEAAAPPSATNVVRILLRITEGVVRKMQGYDTFCAARGCAADALLGMARLLLTWPKQRLVQQRLLHQAVTAMEPRHAEELLTRLLLARYSPAVEAEPGLRSKLGLFFKAYQDAAAKHDDDGVLLRRILGSSLLAATRCAIALPAPAGAPTTARGCAAPALLEFGAELLAGATAAAAAAKAAAAKAVAASDGEDEVEEEHRDANVHGQAATGDATSANDPGSCDSVAAVVRLCELVLEELVRLASPGGGGLDVAEPRVKAYASELCKIPMRLVPALPLAGQGATRGGSASLAIVRRLAFLGRRAVAAAQEELAEGGVVPGTAVKKLQEFLRLLEEAEQSGTAPLTEQEVEPILKSLLAQLGSLPSLEAVTAGAEADPDWDQGPIADPSETTKAGGRARRGGAARGKAAATTTRTRARGSRQRVEEEDDDEDADGNHAHTHDDDDDEADSDGSVQMGRRRAKTATTKRAAAKVAGARAAVNRSSAGGGAAASASQGSMPSGGSQSQDLSQAPSQSQGERRSSRTAAAKAAERLKALRDTE